MTRILFNIVLVVPLISFGIINPTVYSYAEETVCFSSTWSEIRGRCRDGDILHLVFSDSENEGVELAIAYFCDLSKPIRSGRFEIADKEFVTCTAKLKQGRQ